jgi:exodeoxyribonuclease-3
LQIATWNVNSLTVRLPQVLDWLSANPVSVLGLQELKMTDDKFPVEAFAQAGYQPFYFGQKTYNGVALLVKNDEVADATTVIKNIPGLNDDQARVIALTISTPQGDLRIVNAYFVNGHEPGSDKFTYKMQWLEALQAYIQSELTQFPRLILMGDFNITFDDADSHDPEGLKETIHHTVMERDQLKALLALGLVDTYRTLHPATSTLKAEKKFTWWDYRDFGFRRNRGLRIDYILASLALQSCLQDCRIDKSTRGLERPSDHVPVVLSLLI